MPGTPAIRSASRGAYTVDSDWRNRDEFFQGREAIVDFLRRKWARELDYRLKKELWCFTATASRCASSTSRATPTANGGEATATSTGSSTSTAICAAATRASTIPDRRAGAPDPRRSTESLPARLTSVADHPEERRWALCQVAPAADTAAVGGVSLTLTNHRPAAGELDLHRACDPATISVPLCEMVGVVNALGASRTRKTRSPASGSSATASGFPPEVPWVVAAPQSIPRRDLAAGQLVDCDVELRGEGQQSLQRQAALTTLGLRDRAGRNAGELRERRLAQLPLITHRPRAAPQPELWSAPALPRIRGSGRRFPAHPRALGLGDPKPAVSQHQDALGHVLDVAAQRVSARLADTPNPPAPRGVAVDRLLTQGDGPLYNPAWPLELGPRFETADR